MSLRVFILAGEPSGDRLGGALMAGLKQLEPDVSFDGIGGALMAEQGLASRFPMDELSVMGLAEVLPKYRHLKRRIRETADAVLETRPDVVITIDSPDFSLRVARLVKDRSNIRTVHYVAPSVWAWRPKRAEKMAQVIDHDCTDQNHYAERPFDVAGGRHRSGLADGDAGGGVASSRAVLIRFSHS